MAAVERVAAPTTRGACDRRHGGALPVPAYLVATLGVVAVAAVLLPLRDGPHAHARGVPLLVPVVAASWLGGVGPGIVAAVASSAAFNAAFLPPYGTFDLERTEYLGVFLGFLVTSLLISWLVGVARDRAAAAEEREAEVRLLFDLSHMLVTERAEGLTAALGPAAERLGFVMAGVQPGAGEAGSLVFPLRVGEASMSGRWSSSATARR